MEKTVSKSRVLTSLHDFIFCMGCVMCTGIIMFLTGKLGCVFSWDGGHSIGMANYEYSGTYKDGKVISRR